MEEGSRLSGRDMVWGESVSRWLVRVGMKFRGLSFERVEGEVGGGENGCWAVAFWGVDVDLEGGGRVERRGWLGDLTGQEDGFEESVRGEKGDGEDLESDLCMGHAGCSGLSVKTSSAKSRCDRDVPEEWRWGREVLDAAQRVL